MAGARFRCFSTWRGSGVNPASMRTELTELLGCRYPLIQTAMGWIANPGLVAASGEAGAFGFLAGAVMTPAEVEAGIEEIKRRTDKPFGVNFHMYSPGAKEIIEICIKHGVKAVSYSRSPQASMIARLQEAGIVCIPTVGALKHAARAVEMGANAVVVQGSEGGGHTGVVASNVLLPQVVDALRVPVVAAGGYKDGRGLVSALAYGAAGIAMGTRFLMTRESPVPDITKSRYVTARAEEIIISTKLDGLPQRMIYNQCLQSLDKTSSLGMLLLAVKNGLAFNKVTGVSLFSMLASAWRMKHSNKLSFAQTLMAANAPMLIQEAMVKGHPETGVLPSGQVAGNIRDLPAVGELIEQIMGEARESLGRLAAIR